MAINIIIITAAESGGAGLGREQLITIGPCRVGPFPLSDREALAGRSMITMTGADRWSASFQAQKLRVHSCTTHQAQQLGKSAFAGGSADGCRT